MPAELQGYAFPACGDPEKRTAWLGDMHRRWVGTSVQDQLAQEREAVLNEM